MLNHGCGGAETLCLITNRLDGVCQCPANMFKRVDQDLAGQNIDTCTSELHQCSCHTLTPSHLHTHTNPHLHSLVCLPSSTSHVTPSHSHPLSRAFSYMSTLIHLTLITPSHSHPSPPHSLLQMPTRYCSSPPRRQSTTSLSTQISLLAALTRSLLVHCMTSVLSRMTQSTRASCGSTEKLSS